MRMNKNRRWESYTNLISQEDKIEVKMQREDGKIIKFSVTYLKKIKEKWREIRRCDNSHPGIVAHCHIFKYNRKDIKTPLKGDTPYLLTKSINEFKKHYNKYLEYYFK